jgi:hypothetical protein
MYKPASVCPGGRWVTKPRFREKNSDRQGLGGLMAARAPKMAFLREKHRFPRRCSVRPHTHILAV